MKFLIKIGKLSPYILSVSFPVFFGVLIINLMFFTASNIDHENAQTIILPEKPNDDQLAEFLAEKGLVRSAFIAKILINKQRKKISDPVTIEGGEYEIPPALLPGQIIANIIKGKPIDRGFEIKAGMTFKDIINSIVTSGLFEQNEIEAAFKDSKLLVRRNIAASIPEGYFLPTTTNYKKPIEATRVAESLLIIGESKRRSTFPNISERAYQFGLDEYKILILASLIEKSGAKDDMQKSKVSSVLLNKLTIGMPLEEEMPLRYQAGDLNKAVNPEDKKRSSPYNTYIKTGLPPTPICTPSLESIKAALFPADTDFIYYFIDNKGNLDFSSSAQEYRDKLLKSS